MWGHGLPRFARNDRTGAPRNDKSGAPRLDGGLGHGLGVSSVKVRHILRKACVKSWV